MFLLLTLTTQKEALNSQGVPWSVTSTLCNSSIFISVVKTVEGQNTLTRRVTQPRYCTILFISYMYLHQRVFSKRDCLMLDKVTLLILTLASIFLFTNWPSLFYSQLHLVFYNNKYDTFSNAVDKPDGLAVLGVLVSVNICNLSLYCLCSF